MNMHKAQNNTRRRRYLTPWSVPTAITLWAISLRGYDAFQSSCSSSTRVRIPHSSFPTQPCRALMMTPDAVQAAADVVAAASTTTTPLAQGIDLPFMDVGKELYKNLDIGGGLFNNVGKVPEIATELVVESIGHDLLVFLLASVIVTPIAKLLNVTPILGYLIIGAILGPHGLDLFANSEAAVELGDFGILFLLFSEGLEVSSSRLQKLLAYLPLGVAQISLVTGVITAGFLFHVPDTFSEIVSVPLQPSAVGINRPVEALVLALAACLSTSAFIFPVLKERGWEDEESGEAATSILLLQDLMVAPLLVSLPFLAADGGTDYAAVGVLTAKATIGFGAVIYLGSLVLQRVFSLVAETGSAETFVALCLLVSAGMGTAAKMFGLTDTAGAFAAGVLLANTNYRAQIQADILPFKGILLGIFFMTAGSNFDLDLVFSQFPTIFAGTVALIFVKALTLGLATRVPEWMEPNRLHPSDALRVALLLSGGGEFAFVVLALAEKLEIIPQDLAGVATAVILITMGVTPILGEIAEAASKPLAAMKENNENAQPLSSSSSDGVTPLVVAHDSVVICGYGEVGRSLVRTLGNERDALRRKLSYHVDNPSIVAFDTLSSLNEQIVKPTNETAVLFGNGRNPEVIRSYGIESPSAIFVAYEDHEMVLDATTRLRLSFQEAPIYTRASTERKARQLRRAGATQVVVEADELPRFASQLIQGEWQGNLEIDEDTTYESHEQLRAAASAASGMPLRKVDKLLEIYKSFDQDGTGLIKTSEIEDVLDKSGNWIANDDEIEKVNNWIEDYLADSGDSLTAIELCCLYARAPDYVKRSFGLRSSSAQPSNV